jgi:hypothetical protein
MFSTDDIAPIPSTLRLRALDARDAVELWRLFGAELGVASPYFFMSLARGAGDRGVVAKRDGAIVGFVIAQPRAWGATARVQALSIVPCSDAGAIAAALLRGLLALPVFHGISVLETASDENPGVAHLFDSIHDVFDEETLPSFFATG